VFSLNNFHRLGSAILSRSFHVEEWKPKGAEGDVRVNFFQKSFAPVVDLLISNPGIVRTQTQI
jgi:hypothetical protein